MLKINKEQAPPFWKNVDKKYKNYNDLNCNDRGKELRQNLRVHLISEQKGICAYCCRSIDDNSSSNEHIKPRADFPQYSLSYNNIVASCKTKNTCTIAKGNNYSDDFVSPLDDDLEVHFSMSPDGNIICLTERAEYTCDLLKLNSYELVEARKAVIMNCSYFEDDVDAIKETYLYKDKEAEIYNAYADAILHYCTHPEIRVITYERKLRKE